MLSGLDPSKMLPINGSSLPRWMLPGFDLNELWPSEQAKTAPPASLLLSRDDSLYAFSAKS
jgi:hypothetical protein